MRTESRSVIGDRALDSQRIARADQLRQHFSDVPKITGQVTSIGFNPGGYTDEYAPFSTSTTRL